MNTTTNRQGPRPSDEQLAEALGNLPQLQPSAALVARLDNIAREAEPTRARRIHWRPALLAACLMIAAMFIWVPEKYSGVGAPGVAATAADDDARLSALIAQSAYLESVLSDLPGEGRVQRVGTASTISALEDRVALIDAQLSQQQVRADTAGSAVLWRQRVGLMNTLVELRGTPREQIWL